MNGNPIPILSNGGLLCSGAGDDQFYLLGGTTTQVNQTWPYSQQPLTPVTSLWSYNSLQKSWTEYSQSPDLGSKVNKAACFGASDQELGFCVGGQVDEGSSDATKDFGDFAYMVEGLQILFTNNQTMRNISAKGISRFPRTRGAAGYISAVGQSGIGVLLGGVQEAIPNILGSGNGSMV